MLLLSLLWKIQRCEISTELNELVTISEIALLDLAAGGLLESLPVTLALNFQYMLLLQCPDNSQGSDS